MITITASVYNCTICTGMRSFQVVQSEIEKLLFGTSSKSVPRMADKNRHSKLKWHDVY